MTMQSIQIPENAVPVSFDVAMLKYQLGHKVLATSSDGDTVYAAQTYAKHWDNLEQSDRDFKEFKKHGKWYWLI
ncbi:hypothetical protein HP398_29760 [Brevibacillus sp. HB1.4B]|uniref:hypothetical protein n=1 Tax=Brevibacillus sp. HB1.4B TaxID=2738845 RepID=UPI00156B737C|nr:hypothetical protein [Brevibacillus sp. HB1.4B]NRS20609.1 hypothetical protein [Brevibacillus sp. HB1.4B]